MIRFLLAILALAAALSAQPVTTPIRDTIRDQFNALYTGTVTIQLATGSTTSGVYTVLSLVGQAQRVRITSGVLSVDLIPNDTMPSGMSYVLTFGNAARQTCFIPTSGTPIKLADYCSPTVPSKRLLLNPNDLSGSNLCVNILSNQLSLSTGCAGSGTTLTLLTLTDPQLLSLSDGLLLTLSN